MDTFLKVLPVILKVIAFVAALWTGGNVALTQVGDGVEASEWWKVLVPGVVATAAFGTAVVQDHKNVSKALYAPPPSTTPKGAPTTDVNLEYLGRIAAACVLRGDTESLKQVGTLAQSIKGNDIAPQFEGGAKGR